jgi:hypothetical protein
MLPVVHVVPTSPLRLSGSLLRLGAALLAPVFLLLPGWGRRQPNRRPSGTAVLLVEAADRLRGRLKSLLELEGYGVLEAGDEMAGFDTLHGSPHPLVVVLDAGHVRLLARVATDRRTCEHHAYVVLCTWRRPSVSVADSLRAQLRLFVVRGPRRWGRCAVPSPGQQTCSPPIRSTPFRPPRTMREVRARRVMPHAAARLAEYQGM